MGVSRQTIGLIQYEEFDAQGNWVLVLAHEGDYPFHWDPTPYLVVDTADKKTGSGSLRLQVVYPETTTGYTQTGWAFLVKALDVGSGAGRRVHVWSKTATDVDAGAGSSGGFYAFRIVDQLTLGFYPAPQYSGHAWTKYDGTLPADCVGNQSIRINYCELNIIATGANITGWVDHLVICQSDLVTFTGLIPGQKVELCRTSDDGLIGSDTVGAGETQAVVDVSAETFPEPMYLKVYASNGSTLVEIVRALTICGGDEYAWFFTGTNLKTSADPWVIYRQDAAGFPKRIPLSSRAPGKQPEDANLRILRQFSDMEIAYAAIASKKLEAHFGGAENLKHQTRQTMQSYAKTSPDLLPEERAVMLRLYRAVDKEEAEAPT